MTDQTLAIIGFSCGAWILIQGFATIVIEEIQERRRSRGTKTTPLKERYRQWKQRRQWEIPARLVGNDSQLEFSFRWYNRYKNLVWTCPTCKAWNSPLTIPSMPKGPLERSWESHQRAHRVVRLKCGVCSHCGKECSLDFNWKTWLYDVGVRYSGAEPSLMGRAVYPDCVKPEPVVEQTQPLELIEIPETNCPNCGAPWRLGRRDCEYCGTLVPIISAITGTQRSQYEHTA